MSLIQRRSSRNQIRSSHEVGKARMPKLAAVLISFNLLLFPGLAFAHAKLVSSMPVQGFTGPSPTEITLTFNEASKVIFVKLRNEKKEELNALSGPEESGKAIKLKVLQPLPPATYSIEYRVITDDGHPVSGNVGFRVN